MTLMRLQKFLSTAGFCSRRKGEEYITGGLVKVNNKTVTTLGTKVDPETDIVVIQGVRVKTDREPVYIILNKPQGYVTSCSHPGEKIVLDLIELDQRLYPVGRLDKDSTGLLILTNDGKLHHRLSHPSFDHEKEYEVTTEKPVTDSALRRMENGIVIKGKRTRPSKIKRISSRCFTIILKEGRNRQIRRMVGKTGNQVIKLMRVRISNVKLGKLAKGNWRYLTENEKKELLSRAS